MAVTNILLDTDIGCDCDDAGALAVLHAFEKQGAVHILGMTHATSTPGGVACMDTINRYFGRGDIPLGRLTDEDLLNDSGYDVYGSAVAQAFSYDRNLSTIPCATDTLRQMLASQSHSNVKLVAIGPLRNIARLLMSQPDQHSPLNGVELVRKTVQELVIMGGSFLPPDHHLYNSKEYNIACDIPSAQTVVRLCPVPIVFSGSEIGHQLITGHQLFVSNEIHNPIWYSYYVHTLYGFRMEGHCAAHPTDFARPSWDQSCVLYAAQGLNPHFTISCNGVVDIDDNGATWFRADPAGQHRYLSSLPDPEKTRTLIDNLMVSTAI